MEELKTNLSQLNTHVRQYVKTYLELAKAKATKGASNAVAGIAIGVTTLLFAFFALFFASFALGWWIGSLLNSMALGFLIVAGIYLLLIGLIIMLRKKVIVPMIRNAIISKIYE
ncbi:phage holin family protein [Paraflavisolibacter sp. H34]|uniref:phage holin family protein n=1 Tax=Huijunlia imazamoxiresistens TaxID=3127457 RepID=UPI0030184BF5